MGPRPHIYGIDIETDTTHGGLDPAVSPVLSVALSGMGFEELYVGDEPDLLAGLDRRLATLLPGVLATWNGATFDLPFLADRARLIGVPLDLSLCLDRRLTCGRVTLPGHGGAYRARWGAHAHLDTFQLYDRVTPGRASLRSLARLVGLTRAGGVQPRTDDLANEVLHANPTSDARLARALAERRWPVGARVLDHLDAEEIRPVDVAVRRVARAQRLRAEALHPAGV